MTCPALILLAPLALVGAAALGLVVYVAAVVMFVDNGVPW